MHLALVFPIERRFAGARRIVPFLPYALSAVLAIAVLHGFDSHPPNLVPLHLVYAYNSAAIACFIGSLVLGYRETRELLPRLRAKAILIGAIICLPWPILAFIDNALSGRTIPVQLTLVLTPFGYASLGYAIVKHDLFDIDRVIRQSFVYTLLSIIVVTTYALLLELPMRLLPGYHQRGADAPQPHLRAGAGVRPRAPAPRGAEHRRSCLLPGSSRLSGNDPLAEQPR